MSRTYLSDLGACVEQPAARDHELNPSTNQGLGIKLGLDATAPYPRPKAFERVKMAKVDLSKLDIKR